MGRRISPLIIYEGGRQIILFLPFPACFVSTLNMSPLPNSDYSISTWSHFLASRINSITSRFCRGSVIWRRKLMMWTTLRLTWLYSCRLTRHWPALNCASKDQNGLFFGGGGGGGVEYIKVWFLPCLYRLSKSISFEFANWPEYALGLQNHYK